MWWMSAVMGQHNRYDGTVHAYAPLFGTGGAVVTLTPSDELAGDKEYDEEDVEVFQGNRTVLGGKTDGVQPSSESTSNPSNTKQRASTPQGVINTDTAPAPVGAYPHARQEGDLLYLSGVGPRQPGTNAIPGGPIKNEDGTPLEYDIEAQTEAVIDNISKILIASGSSLEDVIDVTAFLVDMDRDFAGYNKVYAKHFTSIGATRTTIAIRALPTPIAVEFKVVARAPKS
ncbi:MAG: RidA family protein, partial [Myxococcota bacterium]